MFGVYDVKANSAGTANATINLNVGQYLPYRVVFGQVGGGAIFTLTVVDPSGVPLISSTTGNSAPASPYIVRFSCDGTTAPPFPYTYGSEL